MYKHTQYKMFQETMGRHSENAICSPSWVSSASPTFTPCESTSPWPSSPWSTTAPSSRRTLCPTLPTLAPCHRVRKSSSQNQMMFIVCKNFNFLSTFQVQPITAARVRTVRSIGIRSNRAPFWAPSFGDTSALSSRAECWRSATEGSSSSASASSSRRSSPF